MSSTSLDYGRSEGGISLSARRVVVVLLLTLVVGALLGRVTAGSRSGDGGPARGEPTPPEASSALHDQQGAAAAAADLSARLASALADGADRVREVADQVGTTSYSARVREAYGSGGHALTAGAIFRAVPISYRVLRYSPGEASVRVWSASILAADDVGPGAASFKTATILVRWQPSGWRVEDVRDAAPGPTPVTVSPSSGSEFVTSLRGMEAFHVQP